MAIESPLQQIIVDYLDSMGVSQRDIADLTGISDTTYGTWRRMSSAMGLNKLDKILTAYPEVKGVVIEYLSGNTEKNITEESKTMKNPEFELAVAKRMMEMIDEKKTELQRKCDKLESEIDGLRKENESLKDQLKNCGPANNKSK